MSDEIVRKRDRAIKDDRTKVYDEGESERPYVINNDMAKKI